jgi:hypothetical protein
MSAVAERVNRRRINVTSSNYSQFRGLLYVTRYSLTGYQQSPPLHLLISICIENISNYVGFEVFAAVIVKSTVFWDAPSCSLEAACCFKGATCGYNPEDCNECAVWLGLGQYW